MNIEPINIVSHAEGPEHLLSNFAHTPFELDGMCFESVEGLLQGLKEEDPEKQVRIFGKHGKQAKRAGTKARNQHVWTVNTVCKELPSSFLRTNTTSSSNGPYAPSSHKTKMLAKHSSPPATDRSFTTRDGPNRLARVCPRFGFSKS